MPYILTRKIKLCLSTSQQREPVTALLCPCDCTALPDSSYEEGAPIIPLPIYYPLSSSRPSPWPGTYETPPRQKRQRNGRPLFYIPLSLRIKNPQSVLRNTSSWSAFLTRSSVVLTHFKRSLHWHIVFASTWDLSVFAQPPWCALGRCLNPLNTPSFKSFNVTATARLGRWSTALMGLG